MNKQKIEEEYFKACSINSDINEHCPTLLRYAHGCEHITELRVRAVVSTWAFLMAMPEKYVGYDINQHENMIKVLKAYEKANIIIADVLTVEIEETDLIFFDTLHIGSQIKKELELHGNKARKYLIFHDVETYGYKPEPTDWQTENIMKNYVPNDTGIMPPILEFMESNKHWIIEKHLKNNNGLLILKRV